ncbi:hypothetical protein U1Q18_032700 [Sarracenia purpurea var. burkii]
MGASTRLEERTSPRGHMGKDSIVVVRNEEDDSDEEDQEVEMPDVMEKTTTPTHPGSLRTPEDRGPKND